MSTQLAQSKEERVTVYMVGGKEVKLTPKMVKDYLTRGNETVTDQEVVMFINLCKFQELNPFINEAYLVKFKGSPAQLIVAREAYEKRAESMTQYEGRRAGIILQRGNDIIEVEGEFKLPTDKLLGGWAEVHRSDRKFPFVSRVALAEYDKGQSTWKSIPCTMIRKTAIVHALREAFPKLAVDGVLDDEPNRREITSKEVESNANKSDPLFIPVNDTEPPQRYITSDGEIIEPQVTIEDDF